MRFQFLHFQFHPAVFLNGLFELLRSKLRMFRQFDQPCHTAFQSGDFGPQRIVLRTQGFNTGGKIASGCCFSQIVEFRPEFPVFRDQSIGTLLQSLLFGKRLFQSGIVHSLSVKRGLQCVKLFFESGIFRFKLPGTLDGSVNALLQTVVFLCQSGNGCGRRIRFSHIISKFSAQFRGFAFQALILLNGFSGRESCLIHLCGRRFEPLKFLLQTGVFRRKTIIVSHDFLVFPQKISAVFRNIFFRQQFCAFRRNPVKILFQGIGTLFQPGMFGGKRGFFTGQHLACGCFHAEFIHSRTERGGFLPERFIFSRQKPEFLSEFFRTGGRRAQFFGIGFQFQIFCGKTCRIGLQLRTELQGGGMFLFEFGKCKIQCRCLLRKLLQFLFLFQQFRGERIRTRCVFQQGFITGSKRGKLVFEPVALFLQQFHGIPVRFSQFFGCGKLSLRLERLPGRQAVAGGSLLVLRRNFRQFGGGRLIAFTEQLQFFHIFCIQCPEILVVFHDHIGIILNPADIFRSIPSRIFVSWEFRSAIFRVASFSFFSSSVRSFFISTT